MKYDNAASTLSLSHAELVSLSYRRRRSGGGECSTLKPARESERKKLLSTIAPTPLAIHEHIKVMSKDVTLSVSGAADKITNDTLTIIRRGAVGTRGEELSRGEGYCLAYMAARCGVLLGEKYTLRIIFLSRGEAREICESITRDAAEAFFRRMYISASLYFENEVSRAARLPTLAHAKFPFGEVRLSQREFMESAYRTIDKGGRLFVSAPTGTGKTMAALFPAVRALGEGKISKIFYLTERGTGAQPAISATRAIVKSGAMMRAVVLYAKEKLCSSGGDCGYGKKRCKCLINSHLRLEAAVRELTLKSVSPITSNELAELASKHHVCPYELALEYSLLCDLIICDCNYLFDLRVYLRRYFDRHDDYCFLIDEAHNLLPRAREMYSSEVSASDFSAAAELAAEAGYDESAEAIRAAGARFSSSMRDQLRDSDPVDDEGGDTIRFAHTGASAEQAVAAIEDCADAIETALSAKRDRTPRSERETVDILHELRDIFYVFSKAMTVSSLYDGKYETFVYERGENYTIKMFCIAPANILSHRLACGRAAIFFSATLTPTDYYRSTLGDGEGEILELDSPFDKENLCIAAMDRISVRYSMREESFEAVCRVIDATVCEKTGNYMIFCPSFDYMEKLARAYSERNTGVRVIVQSRRMNVRGREEFLASFKPSPTTSLCAFCVLGGIYAEGIDLAGDRLIGAMIVGVGMPALSVEREAIAAYYDRISDCGNEYAYIYPGMNRVMQAAGRVIRSESDRGVLVLIDERFSEETYRRIVPEGWHSLKYAATTRALTTLVHRFWNGTPPIYRTDGTKE